MVTNMEKHVKLNQEKIVIDTISNQHVQLYLATKDGEVLLQGIENTRLVVSNDTVSFQSLNQNGNLISNVGSVSCKNKANASSLNIWDIEYLIHCHPIDIMGKKSVYVLAVPQNGSSVNIDLNNYKKKGLKVLIAMIVMILIAILSFLFINVRGTRREMQLCGSLIKQMEATQQAERKNMNKSLAFASASHDVRTSLAGLTGLIEMSYELVTPHSELETNLKQMNNCTRDLLGLLNSILDTSKIEAGKMHLEEEDFDISYLLEDVVDLYHPVAMKKGVDIVLDPCNGSLMRYSSVKGDRGKLKQVLCNLLSNAVKFTDEGHIAVRAWAQKPNLPNSIMATNRYSFTEYLSCLCYKKSETKNDIEAAKVPIQQDPYSIDVTFEVDDTGKGIPKEKYKSVFENYVQVKETALGRGGTGLGLGIVQSLVRLMHGDIGIMDKDIGEKGTCFRFNVVLSVCETVTNVSTKEGSEHASGDRNNAQGLIIRTTSSGSSICNSLSPKLHIYSTTRRPQASHVVLLIVDKERRRISQRFMESLGIEVKVVRHWKHLFETLKHINQKGIHSSNQSSPVSSEFSFRSISHSSFARTKGFPLSSMDGTESMLPVLKKNDTIGAAPGFILIVIDANAGPFSELCRVVSIFRKGLYNPCKVVWLNKPLFHGNNFKTTLNKDLLDPNDIVISKPFHGTRLFQVIKLLPEYGGAWKSSFHRSKKENGIEQIGGKICRVSSLSKQKTPLLDRSKSEPNIDGNSFESVEQMKKGTEDSLGGTQECGDSSNNKSLSGKRILVVEDNALLRKLALATLIPLGVTIEQCENGEQAVQLIEEGLARRDIPYPPYDYILMDCEMPVMDGFEATKQIREMERPYGFHIPIIALTAHTDNVATKDGMDFHLLKPIKRQNVLEAIRYIHAMLHTETT
ncbi:putative histidine kinase response regulator and transcription factor RR-A-type family [Lupinus albus]|uniref:histidine kinase n=1 Tax=Lupinus albus TaxID=3870 RepID=A0A6A4NJ46_LUPAL|nr:putative histidine kinase response regulator and transcription factor RR-A-type family [Lupinus albus]